MANVATRLAASQDPVECAALAAGVVRSGASYLDVTDRAVLPAVAPALDPAVLDVLRREREDVRVALEDAHRRTRHLKPANARANDPAGFDEAMGRLGRNIALLLETERRDLLPAISALSPQHRDDLARSVAKVARHAGQQPKPGHNPVSRAIKNFSTWLDSLAEDTAQYEDPIGASSTPPQRRR